MATKTETINKNLSFALKSPRITEKASLLSARNVYTFNVPKDFNKIEVAKAVEAIYKVKPVQVRMVAIPAKNFTFRGRPGVKGGGKKALVFLKKGDKIEFV
ncbi:MAG: 50S ribosomal protein L23 [Candidatus Paceibacterota bacterium]|jgi:large subunit ribosomal protein L23